MLSLYRTLSLRYLRQRWARAALVTASIALGVATLVATLALNRSIFECVQNATTPLTGFADLYVSNGESGVRMDLAPSLARIPGVRSVDPVLVEHAALPDLNDQPALLLGVDLAAQGSRDNPMGVEVKLTNPLALWPGRLTAFLGKDLLADLERALPPGSRSFRVRVAGHTRELPLHDGTVDAHGPAAALGGSVLVLDAAALAKLVGRADLVTRLDVTMEPGADPDRVRQDVADAFHGLAEVRTPESNDLPVQDVMAGLQLGFAVCGTGALVVGLFLVYNALSVSVAERRYEIGVLRSLGATRDQVWRLFVGEAALLGVAGSALGLPAGQLLARLGLGPMQEVMGELFVVLKGGRAEATPLMMAQAAAAGVATAIVASLLPALRAAREQPADVVRRLPPAQRLGGRVLHLAASLALVAAGAACVAGREALPPRVGTYGGLVLFLFGLLLLTPVLAEALSRLVRPAVGGLFGIEERLAADNLVRSPGRTGLVITALAAGVALFLQTAGVIRSNEDPILDWVDRTIAADLFVTSVSPVSGSGQNQPLPEEFGRRLAALPGVATVVPVRFRLVDFGDTRVFLEALDARAFYEADRGHGAGSGLERLPLLAEAGVVNVLISDNFATLHRVGEGDVISLRGPHGPVEAKVVGTVVDYSWNRGSVIMDRRPFRELFEDPLVDVFDVFAGPGAAPEQVEALRETMLRRWGAEYALAVLDRDELRGRITGIIHRLYGIAYGQEAVVGVVAALGVVTALLISVLQRRHELGLLRAVGATRGQVLRTVLAEAALMGVLGTLIGLVWGVALEWYCVQVILFEESGFFFPVRVAWLEGGLIALVGVACALLAGLGPALHTSRLRIPEAIAYE
jgi:putative ABC transport system permease protein